MPKRQMPRGGRYTRPRRGFRVKSHYQDRLKKRGLRNSDVRMGSIYALRKRQGIVPGYADGDSGAERLDTDFWDSETDL